MKTFTERTEYLLKLPNSSFEFPVNKVQSKTELQGLLNKYKIVRVLYNGENTYVWKADEADHSFVRKFINDSEKYYGFMIEDNNKIILPIVKNNELIQKFKQKYME